MCEVEAPSLEMKETMLSGVAWPLTIVNMTAGYQKIFAHDPKLGFLAHVRWVQGFLDHNMLPPGAKTTVDAARMIFNDRLDEDLRSKLGLAYDGSVSLTASEVMKGYGYIEARGTLAPDKDQVFYDTVLKIAADIVGNGVTADELERARNPLSQYMNDKNKNNEDWQSTLAGLHGNPVLNDYRVRQYAAYMAVTPYDIQQLAGRFLKADRVLRAAAVPAAKP